MPAREGGGEAPGRGTGGSCACAGPGDGVRYGARGILGGADGLPHRYIHHGSGGGRVLPSKLVGIAVEPGDVFEVLSGGGWGDPPRRSEAAAEEDRLDGVA